ncbi:MAG: 3-hydroxyacyl-CoA dehydrogenase [fadN-fadA-fadE operon] / Enoyl-CoA hydratase [fadN-fadA-fadE operon], partial [uncultured Rubrobacteraceae bacterium]
ARRGHDGRRHRRPLRQRRAPGGPSGHRPQRQRRRRQERRREGRLRPDGQGPPAGAHGRGRRQTHPDRQLRRPPGTGLRSRLGARSHPGEAGAQARARREGRGAGQRRRHHLVQHQRHPVAPDSGGTFGIVQAALPGHALLQPAALPEAARDHPDRGHRRGDRREGQELRGAGARQGRGHRQGHPELYREQARLLCRDAGGHLRLRERLLHRRGGRDNGAPDRAPQDRHLPPQRHRRTGHRRRGGREPLRGRPGRRVARGPQAPPEAQGDAGEGPARQQDRRRLLQTGQTRRQDRLRRPGPRRLRTPSRRRPRRARRRRGAEARRSRRAAALPGGQGRRGPPREVHQGHPLPVHGLRLAPAARDKRHPRRRRPRDGVGLRPPDRSFPHLGPPRRAGDRRRDGISRHRGRPVGEGDARLGQRELLQDRGRPRGPVQPRQQTVRTGSRGPDARLPRRAARRGPGDRAQRLGEPPRPRRRGALPGVSLEGQLHRRGRHRDGLPGARSAQAGRCRRARHRKRGAQLLRRGKPRRGGARRAAWDAGRGRQERGGAAEPSHGIPLRPEAGGRGAARADARRGARDLPPLGPRRRRRRDLYGPRRGGRRPDTGRRRHQGDGPPPRLPPHEHRPRHPGPPLLEQGLRDHSHGEGLRERRRGPRARVPRRGRPHGHERRPPHLRRQTGGPRPRRRLRPARAQRQRLRLRRLRPLRPRHGHQDAAVGPLRQRIRRRRGRPHRQHPDRRRPHDAPVGERGIPSRPGERGVSRPAEKREDPREDRGDAQDRKAGKEL